MHLTCPACGAVHSLDVVLSHEAASSALVRAMGMTPLGRRLVRYLALWRTGKRALSWDRTAALLDELLTLIEAGKIERHGRLWPAPQDYWIAAIDEMIARRDAGTLRCPVRSHGYLLEIIAAQSNRAEASAERTTESRAAGRTPVGGPAPTTAPAPVPTQSHAPVARQAGPMPQSVRAILAHIKPTEPA